MDFPANSHSVRATEKPDEPKTKKIEPIVTGNVIRRKQPLGKRFVGLFVSGDAPSVWSYVLLDVLIPAAKDMVADAVSQGFERMLFGEGRSSSGRRPGSRSSSGSSGYVSYNRYASNGPTSAMRREDARSMSSRSSRKSPHFDEIVLATRAEAEEVIDRLFDLVSRYESATVADLYELLGMTGEFTDDKWGWSDIQGASVQRVREGYLLKLPRPEPMN